MRNSQKSFANHCKNYLNKATRELNLEYIQKANNKYKKDHN